MCRWKGASTAARARQAAGRSSFGRAAWCRWRCLRTFACRAATRATGLVGAVFLVRQFSLSRREPVSGRGKMTAMGDLLALAGDDKPGDDALRQRPASSA